jgi:hypothetical protein
MRDTIVGSIPICGLHREEFKLTGFKFTAFDCGKNRKEVFSKHFGWKKI